jgi:L-alanine-DL-glutamate epimerase-like enolase superfamily enzyme
MQGAEAVGDRIEVMIGHGYWDLPDRAHRGALEYRPAWLEDMVLARRVGHRRCGKAPRPIGVGAAGDAAGFRRCWTEAVDIVMIDPTWAGGITGTRKIHGLADSTACRWPCTTAPGRSRSWRASPEHLVPQRHLPGVVRAYLRTWYRDLVTALP